MHSVEPQFTFLFELLDAPCIWIVGPQGSGKSSKLAWFGLEHAKRGDRLIIVNPMASANSFKGIKVYGKGLKYRQAEEGIASFVREAKRRVEEHDPLLQATHWSLLCDELNGWVDPEIMSSLMGLQQVFRQVNMSVRLVSYSASTMNGSAVMNRQFIGLEAYPSALNNLRCFDKALLHVPGQKNALLVRIPDWMQAPQDHDFRPFLKHANVLTS